MDDPLYLSEPFTKIQAWIDLLLLAAYKDGYTYVRGIRVDYKRGQVVMSLEMLAKRWMWSKAKVLRYLRVLGSETQVLLQKSNVTTLISIVNYERYQAGEYADDIPNEYANDTPNDTPNEYADVTALYNKEDKEDKNIKETSLTRGTEKTEAAAASSCSTSDEVEPPESGKGDNMPFAKIKNLWNEVCIGYPKLHSLSESRRNKIRNRVAEMGGAAKALPLLGEILAKMQASHFLRGDNKRGWKASFDWLFENDKNWVKVYEGNYDNRPDIVEPITIDNHDRNTNPYDRKKDNSNRRRAAIAAKVAAIDSRLSQGATVVAEGAGSDDTLPDGI